MSADNGIYILECKDQYRVIHAQAIDNLYWTFLDGMMSVDKPVSTRIVEMYGDSRYTRDINMARNIAFSMEKRHPILEYGVSSIRVNKTWYEIVQEAKKLAPLEIEAINNTKKDDRWDWNIKRLEKIIAR